MRLKKVFIFSLVVSPLFPAAAGSPYDPFFSVEAKGNEALRAGEYLRAIDELRDDSTHFGLLKRGIAYLRSGDSAKALASLTAGPFDDAALGVFALELAGDIAAGRQPELALDCYENTLRTNVPDRYRDRIFDKISALAGDDSARIDTALLWPEYSRWRDARRPSPPEPLALALDSLAAARQWARLDSLLAGALAALSDSGRCAVVKSLAAGREADGSLSAASLFLLAKTAMACGQTGTAERLAAASRKRPDFDASVGDREFERFRGTRYFRANKTKEAITALTGYVRHFGYESDLGLLIARAYKILDKNDKAAEWYDRFIAATPKYPAMAEVLWRRAWIEEERGRFRAAAVFFKRIYTSYPRSSRAQESFLRNALCLYRDQKFVEALREFGLFETKYRESTLSSAARYWRAKCLFGLKKDDTAKAHLAALAQEEPYDYYVQRARDLLLHYGDSAGGRFCLDTCSGADRAARWLDSVAPPSGKTLSRDDSISIRRGFSLAAIGLVDDAEMFIEPVELSYPENLSLEFMIALFYREVGATAQASRSGRRLSWRIPQEFRSSVPLPVYEVMFPSYYRDIISVEASLRRLEPAFVLAVIRQESVFNPSVVSRAGAIGLMQIMPATGAEIARDLGERYRVDTLYHAPTNIRYGTFYLRKLLDQFDDNEVLAIAGYNGGPHNAAKWHARSRGGERDLFIEDISFTETRNYVKKVLANYWFYLSLFSAGRCGALR